MDNYTDKLAIQTKEFSAYNAKRRSDGQLYRTRTQMKEAYDKSKLFYPFSAIWNLDYCWTVCKSHVKNSLVFSVPISLVLSYALNPEVRTKGLKSRPLAYYISIYTFVYAGMISIFLFDALAFCDYCKPWSRIYSLDDSSEKYKDILKGRIKEEQKSSDIKYLKTRTIGLKDEEI